MLSFPANAVSGKLLARFIIDFLSSPTYQQYCNSMEETFNLLASRQKLRATVSTWMDDLFTEEDLLMDDS